MILSGPVDVPGLGRIVTLTPAACRALDAMARHRALAIPAREVHPATRERLTADRLAVASDGWLAITADGRAVADWLGAS